MTSQQIEALFSESTRTAGLIIVNAGPDADVKDKLLALMLAPLHEIAYQLAVQNERAAEAAPTQIVQRIRDFEDRISVLEALRTGTPIYSMPSSANAQPTAQEPTPEAKA